MTKTIEQLYDEAVSIVEREYGHSNKPSASDYERCLSNHKEYKEWVCCVNLALQLHKRRHNTK